MELIEIIKKRLEWLYEELDKSFEVENQQESSKLVANQELIENSIAKIKADPDNIIQVPISEIVDLLFAYRTDLGFTKEEYLRQIKAIITLLKGINERGFDFELTANQNQFFNNFIYQLSGVNQALIAEKNQFNQKVTTIINKRDSIIAEIESLEEIQAKIINKSNKILNEADFQIIFDYISNPELTNQERMDILIAFRNYNDQIVSAKGRLTTQIDIDTVKHIFRDYGFGEDMMRVISKYEDEITHNADIVNIKGILDYFILEDEANNKQNILAKFPLGVLIAIVTYSNPHLVEKIYSKIMLDGNPLRAFYEDAAVWSNEGKRQARVGLPHRGRGTDSKKATLYAAAHETSYEEMCDNERFLQEKGYPVQIKTMNQENTRSVLKTPYYNLKNNYRILDHYHLISNNNRKKFPLSVFACSKMIDSIDRFIELGLFGNIYPDHPCSNYLTNGLSALNSRKEEEMMALLYKLKRELPVAEYYTKISSGKENHSGPNLANYLTMELLGYDLRNPDKFERFKADNFIELAPNYIPNAELYTDYILRNEPLSFDSEILNDPLIKNWEEQYRLPNNDYVYLIEGEIVSRNKALRVYCALKKKFGLQNDIAVFALAYNMYIDYATLTKLAAAASYQLGPIKEPKWNT